MIRLQARRRHPGSADDRLIPMINVIFLLLMFFLVSGRVSERLGEDILSPESLSTAPLPAAATELVLREDGVLLLAEVVVPVGELRARLLAAGALDAGLRLRADARLEAARLLPALEALRAAGVERVALVTVHRDDGVR